MLPWKHNVECMGRVPFSCYKCYSLTLRSIPVFLLPFLMLYILHFFTSHEAFQLWVKKGWWSGTKTYTLHLYLSIRNELKKKKRKRHQTSNKCKNKTGLNVNSIYWIKQIKPGFVALNPLTLAACSHKTLTVHLKCCISVVWFLGTNKANAE